MHYLIKSRQVFWLKFPNNAPGFFQMFSRQSVLIMRRHRLNIIFTSFGKNDICCFQKTTNFFMPNNLIESVLVKETFFLRRKMPTIMYKPFILCITILPKPIQSGQFRVTCVHRRNIVASIVCLKAQIDFRMKSFTYL